jgi:hypothetical protein
MDDKNNLAYFATNPNRRPMFPCPLAGRILELAIGRLLLELNPNLDLKQV